MLTVVLNNKFIVSFTTIFGILSLSIIMTEVTERVHLVHLMNVDSVLGGRQPSDQASRHGPWVCRKLAATVHIHRRHCYYYSARKLILVLPHLACKKLSGEVLAWLSVWSMEDGRLSRPRHCSKSAQSVPKTVYRSSCRDKHNCPQCDSNLGPLTLQSDTLTTWPVTVIK